MELTGIPPHKRPFAYRFCRVAGSMSFRSNKRRQQPTYGPAEVDSLESRLLLTTTPNLLTPVTEFSTPTPQFTWESVDNAVSYDIWIASLETPRPERVVFANVVGDTKYTPAEGELGQGSLRVWVRANFADNSFVWSPSTDLVNKSAPTINGPLGLGARNLTSGSTPEITWTSSKFAGRFQVWVTDLTAKARAEADARASGSSTPVDPSAYASLHTIQNRTALVDGGGNAVNDVFGNPIHDEVRSIVLPASTTEIAKEDGIIINPAGTVLLNGNNVAAVDDTSDAIVWKAHGLQSGDLVKYDSRGETEITGLTTDTEYVVITVDADHIKLAATANDAQAQTAIDLGTGATGTMHRLSKVVAKKVFETGRYRIWMRSFDLTGRVSVWSQSHTFDVGAEPTNLSPASPTFSNPPTLEWDSVPRATHYEISVNHAGQNQTALFRRIVSADPLSARQSANIVQSVALTPIIDIRSTHGEVADSERPLLDENGNEVLYRLDRGSYTFWVRAINMGAPDEGIPIVEGSWSGSNFSSLVSPTNQVLAPQVNGPVADDQGFVTSANPEITWTPVHGAVRYEVLIHQFNSRPPFYEATSTTTSHVVTKNLVAGNYTVWVRAVDARGNRSPWSDGFAINASGGRPIVKPGLVAGSNPNFPVYEWTAVANAESYEIWISQDGVKFNFVNTPGIQGLTYAPNPVTNPASTPFASGNYRVWVRAMFADGSTGPWSTPVSFTVADADDDDADQLLLAEFTDDSNASHTDTEDKPSPNVPQVADVPSPETEESGFVVAVVERSAEQPIEASQSDTLPTDVVSEIAQQCVDTEWWAEPA